MADVIILDGFIAPIKAPAYTCTPTSMSAYVKYSFISSDGTQCLYDMKYGVRNYDTSYLPSYLEDIEHEIATYPSGGSLYKAEYLLMLQQEIKHVMAERLIGIGKRQGSVRENAKHAFKG